MMRSRLLLLAVLATPALAAQAQGDAQPTIDAARAAARADRNPESAQLFERAITQAPHRRRELLQEFADQLLYSGRASQAVPLYQEALLAPRDEAERQRALKGLGLAYLWTDQASLARPVFEGLAAQSPQDADISRNLGRALSWSGRQREAARHLAAHLHQHPGDDEARVQLAQAQHWMGRSDQALRTLQGMTRQDAVQLRARALRELAPRTLLDAQRSSQSDELDIRAWRAQHLVSFQDGRGSAGLRYERFDYEREDRSDGARVERPMLMGRYRFSDALEWNVEAGRQRTQTRSGPDHAFTAYNTWLTWWPSDLLRMDVSSSRGDFDNLKSLRQGLTHRDTGLSLDFTPSERHRATVRLQHADYSDGNRRRMGQLEGEYRWRTHPEVWTGARYTRFEFDRQLDNGYFNPLRFESLLTTLRVLWRPVQDDERWELSAHAAYGREHAVPDGDKPTYDLSLRTAWRIDPRTRLELRAQRFSSRTSSASGFARTVFGARLERSW